MEKEFMDIAILEAYKGIENGHGGPFGAVLVKEGKVLAAGHNTVLKDNDPTHHAEINVISQASAKLRDYDLSGSVIFSTSEPCPMCFSAIHWAKIGKIFYGTEIEEARKLGFNELTIPVSRMKKEGGSTVDISPGFMLPECRQLLDAWRRMPDRKVY